MAHVSGYGVFLQANVPTEFLSMFSDYVIESPDGLKYLLSASVEPGIHFVGLSLVRKGHEDWEVQIPCAYVLAIVAASDPKMKLGFVNNE